jgi:5'-nucleotidase
MKLIKQCKFPWMMANVLDRETGKPYAGAHDTVLLDWNGVKVGFVGLVEEEW